MKQEPLHPAEQYAADVLAGRITVNKWVRKAVERQQFDLETGPRRGFIFDRRAAMKAIKFFSLLKHTQGEWAGKDFILEPWQQFIIWVLFGWKKITTNMRRFRMGYVKVARKNGKSTLAAAIGLLLFLFDNEPGAQVYTAATKRAQARIVHAEAVAMVRKSPSLSKLVTINKDNLSIPDQRCKFEPLGADEGTDDGLNVHGAIIDELHAHKTRRCLDVLDSATGSRRQPLLFIITTAGAGKLGVDQDQQKYCEKILGGLIEDDSMFCIMYGVDEEDEWTDEKCWIKANPNLGVSCSLADLQAKCKKAIEMPTFRNEFLQKHLNRQTEQFQCFIPIEKWAACRDIVADDVLKGRPCFIGIDLSNKIDISAVVAVFPPTESDPKWRIKPKFFVPQESADRRERENRVPYATWGRLGHVELTPGNVIDYAWIEQYIAKLATEYEIQMLAFDPWNATQTAQHMDQQGMKTIEVVQGYRSLSEPTKEFEKLVVSKQLGHDGNPVMDWMVSNVAIDTDPAGNIKCSKAGSSEKIDGVAATVTGLAPAIQSQQMAYDGKDLLIL